MFGAIRERLMVALKVPGDLRGRVVRLAPELFMGCLAESGVDLEGWLTAGLIQGEPNFAHFVLAAALGAGAAVWTANVDTLIEQAAGGLGAALSVAAYPQEDPGGASQLLKPHGSIDIGRYVFRSDQVICPLLADRCPSGTRLRRP